MSPSLRYLPLLALPLLMAASSSCTGGLEDNFDDAYTWNPGGCADVTVYASADDDTLGLIFMAQGNDYVADAQASGQTTTYVIDLSEEADVALEVRVGRAITQPVCNDVWTDETQVDETYTAISGQATLIITPDPEGGEFDIYADAVFSLQDVVLTNAGGATVRMDDWGPVEVGVGWLPG